MVSQINNFQRVSKITQARRLRGLTYPAGTSLAPRIKRAITATCTPTSGNCAKALDWENKETGGFCQQNYFLAVVIQTYIFRFKIAPFLK